MIYTQQVVHVEFAEKDDSDEFTDRLHEFFEEHKLYISIDAQRQDRGCISIIEGITSSEQDAEVFQQALVAFLEGEGVEVVVV